MNKKDLFRLFGLVLVIAAPVFFILLFRPLTKVPRPKPPVPKYLDTIVLEKNDRGGYDSVFLYEKVPNQRFVTQNGEDFYLDSLRGKIYVIDFFFTNCPGICPQMTNQLLRVQKAFIKDEQFQIISVSVDPSRDSIARLNEYANAKGAIPGKWRFLYAPKKEVYDLANNGFHLVAKEEKDAGEDGFVHTPKITLVDQNGVIREYYDGTDSSSVNKMMGDIVLLLRNVENAYSFRKDPKQKESTFKKIINYVKSGFSKK